MVSYWHEQARSYPCPTCGAEPGSECITKSGRKTEQPHADRGRYSDRCPKCHTKLLADQEPGELCARCALIRSLEIERATTYVRKNPN